MAIDESYSAHDGTRHGSIFAGNPAFQPNELHEEDNYNLGISTNHTFLDSSTSVNNTEYSAGDIWNLVGHVRNGSFDAFTSVLSEWQIEKLAGVNDTDGIACYLKNWLIDERKLIKGTFCNATWDNFYCWPPTENGTTVNLTCTEILKASQGPTAPQIEGTAIRVCLANSTWLWGNWTNYTECANSYDEYVRRTEEESKLVVAAQHILFIGSILSILCLGTALWIFYHFKCLRCDRVTVHVHLMVALLLRSILLIIITEPFVFNRTHHYRTIDFVCKTVLSVNLYATMASINWMFLQGVYLHGKLTTNVFDRGTPFKVYYTIGWVLPLCLIIIYVIVMIIHHPVQCWKDYSDLDEIWIVLGPMIFCLFVNFFFLINIMRILLTTVQRTNSSSDAAQFRRAVKATFILFPLLGVTNLFFLHNPGGVYNKYFVVLNTLFSSTQGISVAILYCFVSKDVRDAIRREYRRFTARRTANSIRRSNTRIQRVNPSPAMSPNPDRVSARRHFRTRFKSSRKTQDQSGGSPPLYSQSPETGNTVMRNETPTPPSTYSPASSSRNVNRNNNYTPNLNPTILQNSHTTATIESTTTVSNNQYTLMIPLKDLN